MRSNTTTARRLLMQKLAGILLLLVCLVFTLVLRHSADHDGTALLLLAPLGLFLVFTRRVYLV